MPSKQKIDRKKVMAALATVCTQCGHAIPPDKILRIDSERVRCPECGQPFVPNAKTREV